MTHQLLRTRNIAALTGFLSTQFAAISGAAEVFIVIGFDWR
jgi:hypothetical protein